MLLRIYQLQNGRQGPFFSAYLVFLSSKSAPVSGRVNIAQPNILLVTGRLMKTPALTSRFNEFGKKHRIESDSPVAQADSGDLKVYSNGHCEESRLGGTTKQSRMKCTI
jgi:hypothetical protein